MADPKYAGLPGIATSEKDVYESGDLPEDDQNWLPAELQSEAVETDEIDTKKSFQKFNTKYLAAEGADFSGKLGANPGYDAGEYCIVSPGETETPTQKLQRLKAELAELGEQLKSSGEPATSPELISELELLNKNASLLDIKQHQGSFSNVMTSLKHAQSSISKPHPNAATVSTPSPIPDKVKIKVSDIEARIANLEKTIGTNSKTVTVLTADTKTKSLTEVAEDLKAKQSLLDPKNLPQIDTRLQAVLNKLNDINKAKKQEGAQQVASDKKVIEIYELMQKWDSVCASLPSIINRLEALKELHEQAANFSLTVQQFESTQEQIDAKMSDTSKLAKQVQSAMKENAIVMQQNIQALDARIRALTTKK